MKNKEVAQLLRSIAQLLEIRGDMVFKIRAYERAALVIEDLEDDIVTFWKEDRLQDIAGVGEALSEKIAQYLETGKLEYYDELKKKIPVNIDELGKIEGLGPKTILKLYKNLKVKDLKTLKEAAQQGKIKKIAGLGEKIEQKILQSIEFTQQSGNRYLLSDALKLANRLIDEMQKTNLTQRISVAGSLRRRKETIGDIDLVVITKHPNEVIDFFSTQQHVEKLLVKGPSKCSIILKDGIHADLRVFGEESFGSASLYFTGSKQHNIHLRKIAISKKMKLNEYGVFSDKDNKRLAGKTEAQCYETLGLNYIDPEIREDEGEIELSSQNKLPKLIQ
ncbi:MAG: helix-hairpin-helix domain-containing protein, partial [Planctomycetota bacterium]